MVFVVMIITPARPEGASSDQRKVRRRRPEEFGVELLALTRPARISCKA
jgi:hypothetical protein